VTLERFLKLYKKVKQIQFNSQNIEQKFEKREIYLMSEEITKNFKIDTDMHLSADILEAAQDIFWRYYDAHRKNYIKMEGIYSLGAASLLLMLQFTTNKIPLKNYSTQVFLSETKILEEFNSLISWGEKSLKPTWWKGECLIQESTLEIISCKA
jgi:hypothetical protein